MHYRRLGNSGLKISEIGLGGWLTFGHVTGEETGRELIDTAFENGINFFDTANVYAAGACELMWGKLLAPYARPSYVLASKVYFPMGDGPNDRGLSRKHIMEQCEASLDRLGTDYIDLYQCHRYDHETPLEETIRAMDDLVHQGKILYWGFSCWPADKVRQTLEICGDRLYAPVSSQPKYNLLMRDLEVEVMAACHEGGIGQVVFCPLEQGLLSGKYRPGQPLPEGSRGGDGRQNQFMKQLVSNRSILEGVEALSAVADEAGCSLSQLSLAWILRRDEISSCITGATRPAQIGENCGASGIRLSAEQLERIDRLIMPVTYSEDYA
jgi:aryl-alcohol dehydrogenase-like predicted oxidoreductase